MNPSSKPMAWASRRMPLRPRAMRKVTTARQLMRVVANFGGFLNRNSDPDPGWRTLWRGFEEIKLAATGYELRGRIEGLVPPD